MVLDSLQLIELKTDMYIYIYSQNVNRIRPMCSFLLSYYNRSSDTHKRAHTVKYKWFSIQATKKYGDQWLLDKCNRIFKFEYATNIGGKQYYMDLK